MPGGSEARDTPPDMTRARPTPLLSLLALCCALAPLCVACDRADAPHRLTIFAAASTAGALQALADDWAAAGHPRPSLVLDASSRLARQVLSGAPADLYLSADQRWMRAVRQAGAVSDDAWAPLAGNTLVVVTPAGQSVPSDLQTLASRGKGRIGIAGEQVPAGRYADAALKHAGLTDRVAPRLVRGGNVRRVLEWVARGEVAAAFVYRTDALAEPRVRVAFAVPQDSYPPIAYLGGVVTRPGRSAALTAQAAAFLALCRSPSGQRRFAAAGFAPPPAPPSSSSEAPL